jgi:hypothetical protein
MDSILAKWIGRAMLLALLFLLIWSVKLDRISAVARTDLQRVLHYQGS